MSAATTTSRIELDQRHSNGITVTLLWDRATGGVTVHVHDEPAGEEFELACAGHEALSVFHHPYAYAAARAFRTALTAAPGL